MNKNQLDLKMSIDVLEQPTLIKKKLSIDEDTSFDIFYDLYNGETEQYLYIKLVENSALAPFYYNRSYSIEDLQQVHQIFKAVNMNEVKSNLNDLFEADKVKLYYDQLKDGIIMELEVSFFVKKYKINFELYKEMIPENEKDDQLINLYNINKQELIFAKEMFSFLKSYKGNIDKKIFEDLKENFDLGEEKELVNSKSLINDSNINLDKSDLSNSGIEVHDDQIKKNFGRRRNGTLIKERKENEDYIFQVTIKNKTEKLWDENFIKFQLDNNSSKIKCKDITYFFYENEGGQNGIFQFHFDAKSSPGTYKCFFDVFIDGKKLDGTQFQLKIEIPEQD